jgi:hypothetical protein
MIKTPIFLWVLVNIINILWRITLEEHVLPQVSNGPRWRQGDTYFERALL